MVEWKGREFVSRARAAAIKGVNAGALVLQTAIKRQLSKGGASNRSAKRPPSNRKNLALNTGHLRDSIQYAPPVIVGDVAKTRVGTNVKYARIHEFGGIITARGGGLTIPISRDAKIAASGGLSAKQAFPGSFVISHGKSAFIVRDTSKGKGRISGKSRVPRAGSGKAGKINKRLKSAFTGKHIFKIHKTTSAKGKVKLKMLKLEVLYQLVKSVRMPARPYFRPAVVESRDKIARVIAAVMKASMRI